MRMRDAPPDISRRAVGRFICAKLPPSSRPLSRGNSLPTLTPQGDGGGLPHSHVFESCGLSHSRSFSAEPSKPSPVGGGGGMKPATSASALRIGQGGDGRERRGDEGRGQVEGEAKGRVGEVIGRTGEGRGGEDVEEALASSERQGEDQRPTRSSTAATHSSCPLIGSSGQGVGVRGVGARADAAMALPPCEAPRGGHLLPLQVGSFSFCELSLAPHHLNSFSWSEPKELRHWQANLSPPPPLAPPSLSPSPPLHPQLLPPAVLTVGPVAYLI